MSALSPPQELPALSVTEQAQRMFLDGVKQIPGVLRVVTRGGTPSPELWIYVYVPSLRSEVTDQVFDLEAEVRRRHPGSRHEVHVRGLKEYGVELKDLDSLVPSDASVVL